MFHFGSHSQSVSQSVSVFEALMLWTLNTNWNLWFLFSRCNARSDPLQQIDQTHMNFWVNAQQYVCVQNKCNIWYMKIIAIDWHLSTIILIYYIISEISLPVYRTRLAHSIWFHYANLSLQSSIELLLLVLLLLWRICWCWWAFAPESWTLLNKLIMHFRNVSACTRTRVCMCVLLIYFRSLIKFSISRCGGFLQFK